MLIVEGYFDVLALHAAGFDRAVGCLGTALTSEQLAAAAAICGKGGTLVM